MRSEQVTSDKVSRILALAGLAGAFLLPAHSARAEGLFIDYSTRPKLAKVQSPSLCLVDPHARVDLKTAHERGHRVLAYISLVELAKGSPAEVVAKEHKVPFSGTNPDWNSRLLNILDPAWAPFIIDCAAKAVGMGFDGFFLDTADSLERVAGPDLGKKAACQTAIISVVKALDQRWPKAQIVINRGFDLLPRLKFHLDGLLVESVYQGFDPATRRYTATDEAGVSWIESRIRAAQALKIPVYATDYVNPAQRDLAQATAKRLKALGCVPLITTPDLTGKVLAP